MQNRLFHRRYVLVLIVVFTIASCRREDRDMYITPHGLAGEVTIIYGYKGGQAATYEGKKRVFNVPASGVLCTSEENPIKLSRGYDFYWRLPNGSLAPMIEIPSEGDPGIQTQLILLSHGPMVINVETGKMHLKNRDSLSTMKYTIK